MDEGVSDAAPSCPICFESSESSLVAGSCGHGVCMKCADQLLLKRQGRHHGHQINNYSQSSSLEFIPTLGSCPLCRKILLYGDLKDIETQQDAFLGDPVDEMLLDTVYAGPMGVGWASLHLFEEEIATTTNEQQEEDTTASQTQVSYILKDDSRLALTDYKFHQATKTIAFRMRNQNGNEGMAVICFSDNYSFISRGMLFLPFPKCTSKYDGIWKRINNGRRLILFNGHCVLHDVNSENSRCLGEFKVVEGNVLLLLVQREAILEYPEFGSEGTTPMDELWTAHIIDTATTTTTTTISSPSLDQSELPMAARLCWKRSINGPVHDEWVLDTSHGLPRYLRTKSEETIPAPISGRDGQLYWRLDAPGPTPPLYNENTLAGNVFVQNCRIGIASYHFEAVTDIGDGSPQGRIRAYISYEHSYAATKWPPLDNGHPIPSRMYFTNIEIQDDTVFRGTIDWMGVHGTTWNNASYWTYEIRFDPRFQCIVGGSVRFEQDDTIQVLSEFGRDLVYINAAVFSDQAAVRELFSVDYFQSVGASEQTMATLRRALEKPAKPHSYLS